LSISDWLFHPSALQGLAAWHAAADAVDAAALLGLAVAFFLFFNRMRRPGYKWLGFLFAPLLVASATTHVVAIYTLGSPEFGVEMVIKLATAVLAVGTTLVVGFVMPRVLAATSNTTLTGLNAALAATVEARTAELVSTNAHLTRAIEESTRVQRALAGSEAQYRVSFEEATVGKVQSDPVTGRLLRANRAYAAMLGYAPEDLVGRNGWELVWPDDRVEEQSAFARVTSGELTAYVREKRFLRRDGTPVWARVSANIVSVPGSGQPDITVAVIENIDDRRKAEAALAATRLDLEAVVVERSAALVQRDLLLREVYHRVKNNLQVVDSILVMQARQFKDPAVKSAFASLRRRVYALGLVHQQLMGSDNLQTFDVAPFLRELSSNIIEGGAPGRISLTVDAPPLDVGLDFAIPLGLLVTELVTNSLKHAFPNGTGHINVVLSRGDDGALDLVVTDDGAGYDSAVAAGGAPSGALGSRIIVGLASQLKATMTVSSDRGTRSEFHIKAAA